MFIEFTLLNLLWILLILLADFIDQKWKKETREYYYVPAWKNTFVLFVSTCFFVLGAAICGITMTLFVFKQLFGL